MWLFWPYRHRSHITVALPVALVDHVYTEHVTFTPMSCAPHDFLALCSSTQNTWGSLSQHHHRSQPYICNSFNSRIYNTNYAYKPAMPSSAPAPVQLVETVWHPQGIVPMKPVIKTISPTSIPHMHPFTSTFSCEPILAVHSDSPCSQLVPFCWIGVGIPSLQVLQGFLRL